MDSGYYAAMTGLVARSQALDTAAASNALANATDPWISLPNVSISVQCSSGQTRRTRSWDKR